jgi:hypothetical protein
MKASNSKSSSRRVVPSSCQGTLPVAFGGFVGTVAVRCPLAAPCDGPGPSVGAAGALVALLDAVPETLRLATTATVPDVALAQAVADGVARSREADSAHEGGIRPSPL